MTAKTAGTDTLASTTTATTTSAKAPTTSVSSLSTAPTAPTATVELSSTARIDSSQDTEALAPTAAASSSDATADAGGTIADAALPTIDWSQLIVVDDSAQTARRYDDAANTAPAALWQEDFVVNLGKTARNPNAGLRFTI